MPDQDAQPAAGRQRRRSLVAMIGPGLLLAATGVGAGDLATGSFVGSLLGTAVLWAVIVGAVMKFVVTEGLARWQIATGETLLEGVAARAGRWVLWLFLPYLLLWSFFVGSALMSATGATLHAILPVFTDAKTGKIVFGAVASLIGLALVWFGGYRLFDHVMRVCIAVMFVTVVLTAILLWPGTEAVLEGLFLPRIPDAGGEGVAWTLALIGGIGGTLTVLCYGYWLREEGRDTPEDLSLCRVDLMAGYGMTAIFGIAMVIIGSNVTIAGSGAQLLVTLSDRLEAEMGHAGKWLFLAGTLGAVFSSLLGVWQCVPYLFADSWALVRGRPAEGAKIDTASLPYRAFLLGIAFVPMLGLFWRFRDVQMFYAVIGAWLFPALALILLLFNGRSEWVGAKFLNRPLTILALVIVLVFFSYLGLRSSF
ncbi:MAG: Nramp family divalent metal transporter [Methyloceanibacter sp.]|nr:Nramp family divalent metal transporter [Methyloceanibacter sp.]